MGQFSKNYRTFTQKIVTKLSKIWVWDPGSGIRKKPIPNPGYRGQKGTGSRIRNTGSTHPSSWHSFKNSADHWTHWSHLEDPLSPPPCFRSARRRLHLLAESSHWTPHQLDLLKHEQQIFKLLKQAYKFLGTRYCFLNC